MADQIVQQESPSVLASRFINNTNRNVFLTGKAGTGKTTFLKEIIKQTHKNAVIVAPTGIAAINAGGVTIHSLFQLPFGAFLPSDKYQIDFQQNIKFNNPGSLIKNLHIRGNKRRLIRELELLIIDEVSMLRSDLLDAMDLVLKVIRRKSHMPFGGVQVLFIGDLLQLPPVVKEEEWNVLKSIYKSAYFFDAQALNNHPPLYIELDKIYRQADDRFISLLNNLRSGSVNEKDIELLNEYYKPGFQSTGKDGFIHLTTHNYKADNINKDALQKLKGKSWFYKAEIKGEFNEFGYPVNFNMELKHGAQIMFIKNDPSGERRFFNGKIGTISSIGQDEIKIEFENDHSPVILEKYIWENIQYTVNEVTNEIEEKIIGTFSQFPIKLAWAITVHKSQGLTFNKAIIDIGNAFAPGQVYVALSRLTSLDGLVLTSKINYGLLSQNNTIIEYSGIKNSQGPLEPMLEKNSKEFLENYILSSFDFTLLNDQFQRHLTSYSLEESKTSRKKYLDWALQLKIDFESLMAVSVKFQQQLKNIIKEKGNNKSALQERVQAAKKYFIPILKKISAKILEHRTKTIDEKKMKNYSSDLLELDSDFYKQIQLITKSELLVNSSISNEELHKNAEPLLLENKERMEQINRQKLDPVRGRYEKRKPVSETRGNKVKPNTKEESYNLYKSGKSIEEIAELRGFAATTIEGHLAHYVALGLIDVHIFVTKEKLGHITEVSKKLDTNLFGPIKQHLGDEYTYAEIRFAMSYNNNAIRT